MHGFYEATSARVCSHCCRRLGARRRFRRVDLSGRGNSPVAVHTWFCAPRSADGLERAQADLSGGSSRILAVPCDVSDPRQVRNLVDKGIAEFGRIDVLVDNAGLIQVGPIDTMSVAGFEQAMAVMFWGTVHSTLEVLPHPRAGPGTS